MPTAAAALASIRYVTTHNDLRVRHDASSDAAMTPWTSASSFRSMPNQRHELSVDVLGGTTHTYPAETSLTVLPHGCGVTLRWTPLEQRSEEWGLCATVDGIELQTEGAFFHEFFGTAHPESMVCDRTVVLVPADGSMPTEVAQKCDVDGRPWFPVWQVLERSTRTVDGTSVEVTHVRMTIRDDDREYEHVDLDMWLDPHGLPVEMSAVRRSLTLTAAIGAVIYTEQYRATLVSLEPMR